MPNVRDQAIVIRHWDWSETSQTVSLFCRQRGVLRGLAKGAHREKGRFSGGLELLTRGQIVAIIKPATELATLTEWDLQEIFPRLRRDLRAHRVAFYIADLIHHALQPGDPHPDLWNAVLDALRSLEAGVDPDRALLLFQWRLLIDAGFRPDVRSAGRLDRGSRNSRALAFDPEEGMLVPLGRGEAREQRAWRVRPTTAKLLETLDRGEFSAIEGEAFSNIERANRLLAAYLRWVLGREPPSLRLVLGEPAIAARRTGASTRASETR